MSNCTIDLKSFSGKSLEEIKQGLSQTQFSPDEMISAIRDYVTDPRKKQMISVWKLLSARNPKVKAFYDFFIQEDNKKFNISQNVINFLNPKSSTNDSTPAVNDSKAEVLDNPTKAQSDLHKSRNFLDEAFRFNSDAINKYRKEINRQLNGVENDRVSNQEDYNRSIIAWKTRIFSNIIDWLKNNGQQSAASAILNRIGDINNVDEYDSIMDILDDIFSRKNFNDTIVWSYGKLSVNKGIHNKASIYGDYVTLKYFDKVLKDLRGNNIWIGKREKPSSLKRYGSNSYMAIKTWNDEERGIDLKDMTDTRVTGFIENTPMYKKVGNEWVKQEGQYLTYPQVEAINMNLYSIATTQAARNERITNPDLIYEIREIYKKQFGIIEGTEIVNKYLAGKTVSELITSLYDDPIKVYPMILYILSHDNNLIQNLKWSYNHKDLVSLNPSDIDSIYSLWNGLFNPENSSNLFSKYYENGVNPNNKEYNIFNLYMASVISTEKSNMIGYDMMEEGIAHYSEKRANSRLNNLQESINSNVSPNRLKAIRKNLSEEEQLKQQNGVSVSNNFDEGGTTVTIKCGDYEISIDDTQLRKEDSIILKKRGSIIKWNRLKATEAYDIFKDLVPLFSWTIHPELGVDFYGQYALFNTFATLKGSTTEALHSLTTLASYIVYNTEVTMQESDDPRNFQNNIRKYYKNNEAPKLVNYVSYYQIAATGKAFTELNEFSKALDDYNGIIDQITNKDASNKSISSAGLSAIATKLPLFIKLITGREDSALKGNSIEKLYNGKNFIRDVRGKDGSIKKGTDFNEREFILSQLLFDYYGQSTSEGGTINKGDTNAIIGVKPGIYSDKSRLASTLIYLNQPFVSYNGKNTTLSQLLTSKDPESEIRKQIAFEIGNIYSNTFNQIEDTLRVINSELVNLYPEMNPNTLSIVDCYQWANDWIRKKAVELASNDGITPDEYWSSTNQYQQPSTKSNILPYVKKAEGLLEERIHNAIYSLQQKGIDVRFIQQISFIKDKKTGFIYGNPLLINELFHAKVLEGGVDGKYTQLPKNICMKIQAAYERNDHPKSDDEGMIYSDYTTGILEFESEEDFWNRKKVQMVSDLLQDVKTDGINLSQIKQNKDLATRISIANKGWIRSATNQLIICKVVNGEYSKSFCTSNDIIGEGWAPYKALIDNLYQLKADHPDFDFDTIDFENAKFDFGKLVEAVNRFYPEILLNDLKESLVQGLIPSKFEELSSKPTRKKMISEIMKSYKRWTNRYSHRLTKSIDELISNRQNELDNMSDEDIEFQYVKTLAQNQVDKLTSKNRIEELVNSLKEAKNYDFIKGRFDRWNSDHNYKLEINPELIKYNLVDYWLGMEDLTSSVGTIINHPFKNFKLDGNIGEMCAQAAGQQIKREVSNTSAKVQNTPKLINGRLPNEKIIVLDDAHHVVFNPFGDGYENGKLKQAATVMDGATFVIPPYRMDEQVSQGSQGKSTDSKPIHNDIEFKTATGVIIKTAAFVLTNARIRTSQSNQFLIHNMLKNDFGKQKIFIDYNGYKIPYKEVYFYQNGQFYHRVFEPNQTGEESIKFRDIPVYRDGTPKVDISKVQVTTTTRPITNNYDLWTLFGGAYSASLNNGQLEYMEDNTSWENVDMAMNMVGTKNKLEDGTEISKVVDANDVDQPLKRARISMCVTEGAIKQGAANTNRLSTLNDENYEVTYMNLSDLDGGQQLDAEHNADEAYISLMTQVVNALGARGYSSIEASKVYDALNSLTNINLKHIFDGVKDELGDKGAGKLVTEFSKYAAKALRGKADPGSMLEALLYNIRTDNGDISVEQLAKNFSISNPSVFGKIISSIASLFTQNGIRIKFPGSMDVLTPSDGIYKLYGGKLVQFSNYLKGPELIPGSYDALTKQDIEQLKELQKQADNTPLHRGDINMGASYKIFISEELDSEGNPIYKQVDLDGNPTTESIQIEDPTVYRKFRDLLNTKENEDGLTNYYLIEDVTKGRDLACINYQFEGTFINDNGEPKTQEYCLWDLDAIHDAYAITEGDYDYVLNTENPRAAFTNLFENIPLDKISFNDVNSFRTSVKTVMLQQAFNALGSGNEGIVEIDGRRVQVNKASLRMKAYEAIASENYATTFGLTVNDSLDSIKNDPLFFLKRNAKLLLSDTTDDNKYDLKLSTTNGVNYHLLLDDGQATIEGLIPKDVEFDVIGDNAWVCNDKHEHLYKVPVSNGKVQCTIYEDAKGNEIIRTDAKGIKFLTESLNYSQIFATKSLAQKKGLVNLFKELSISDNYRIQNFLNNIVVTKEQKELPLNQRPTARDIIESNTDKTLAKSQLQWISRIEHFYDNQMSAIQELNRELETATSEDQLSENTRKRFRSMIRNARETMTSFINSLDFIASRTPAQSHQSFMPMTLVGFDKAGKNSAYVSRWQLWLQGSDYDIDKVNMLGQAIKNGKFIKWSNFMSLQSPELLRASKELPFPTGKELEVVSTLNKRIYDYMDKPISIRTIENGYIFTLPNHAFDQYVLTKEGNQWTLNQINNDNYTKQITPFEAYILERAVSDRIPEGDTLVNNVTGVNFDQSSGIINEVNGDTIVSTKNSKQYDYNADLNEFNSTLQDIIFDDKGKVMENPNSIKALALMIDAYNRFGQTLENNTPLVKAINKHNTYLNDKSKDSKEAAINFVSSYIYKISSDPVNNLQAMTSIDVPTDRIKDIAKSSSKAAQQLRFDPGNFESKIRQQVLTLGGKQNTGIVASALKTFEAMSQACYEILNFGTQEEQENLLSHKKIAGYNVDLVANAYAKNYANIRSGIILNALSKVNNIEDAFILFSAFLSLSTDNAKDPTLPKINATPQMIGLYMAGLSMGLPLDFLCDVMQSKTAVILADLQQGNIFANTQGQYRVSGAIDYLKKGPDVSLDNGSIILLREVMKAFNYPVTDQTPLSRLKNILLGDSQESPRDIEKARKVLRIFDKITHRSDKKLDEEEPLHIQSINSQINNEVYKYERSYKKGSLSKIDKIKNILSQNPNNKSAQKELNRYNAYKLAQKSLQETGNISLETEDKEVKKVLKKLQKVQQQIEDLQTKGYQSIIENAAQKLQDIQDKKSEVTSKVSTDRNPLKERAFLEEAKAYLNMIEKVDKDWFTGQPELVTDEDGNAVLSQDGTPIYESKNYKYLTVLEQLNKQSEEMGTIRTILALNQGIPNSLDAQLAFVRNFESIIDKQYQRASADTKAEVDKYSDIFIPNIDPNDNSKNIDIVKFAFDSNYRQRVIKAYNPLKYTTNVFQIIEKNTHYLGYLQTTAALYESFKKSSLVYNIIDQVSREILTKKMHIYKASDLEKAHKKVQKFVQRKLNNEFLHQIPVGTVKLPNVPNLQLGTEDGNKAFKEYMDNIFFPRIKRTAFNDFTRHLTQLDYNRTDSGNTEVDWAIDLDTMSNNETERDKYLEAKAAYSNMTRVDPVLGISQRDAIFLYNLITYNQEVGKHNLTDIITDVVKARSSDLINNYNDFLSSFEKSGTPIVSVSDPNDISAIERFTAPVVTLWELENNKKLKYPYVKVQNTDTKEYQLLELKQKIDNSQQESDPDGTYDFIMEDIMEDYDDSDQGYDEEFEDDSTSSRQPFEVKIQSSNYNMLQSPFDITKLPGVSFDGKLMYCEPLKSMYDPESKLLYLNQNIYDRLRKLSPDLSRRCSIEEIQKALNIESTDKSKKYQIPHKIIILGDQKIDYPDFDAIDRMSKDAQSDNACK